MATSEEFKRQFRAGNFVEALKLALAEAAELKVTTWVAPTTTTHPQLQAQPTPGHRLLTRMNLLEGDIDNEVGTAFLNDGPYSDSELLKFHLEQVESGQQTIHGNLQGLRELFATLTHDSPGGLSPANMGAIDPMIEATDFDEQDSERDLFRQVDANFQQKSLRPSQLQPSPIDVSAVGQEALHHPITATPDASNTYLNSQHTYLNPQPSIVSPPSLVTPPQASRPYQPATAPDLDLDLSPDVLVPAPSDIHIAPVDTTPNNLDAGYPSLVTPDLSNHGIITDRQPSLEPLVFESDVVHDDYSYQIAPTNPSIDDFLQVTEPSPATNPSRLTNGLTNGLGNVQSSSPQPPVSGNDLAWADRAASPFASVLPIDPGLYDPDSYEPGIRDPEDLYESSLYEPTLSEPAMPEATMPEPDVYYPKLPDANGSGDHSSIASGNPGLRPLLTGMICKLFKGQMPTAQEVSDLKMSGAATVDDITQGRTTGETLAAGAAIIAVLAFLLWGADRMGVVDVPFIESGDPSSSQVVPPTPVTGFTTPIVLSFDFTDVPPEHWAHPFITAMAERKFVEGNPQGDFEPDKQISRAQFAALLSKPLNQPPRNKSMSFKDVKTDYWASQVIDEAIKTAFMHGYPKRQFRPENSITRAEALVTLVSGLGLKPSAPPAETLAIYKDRKQIPKWAREAIAAATEAGLVVNHPDLAVLNPQQPTTRAEATAMMHQALVRLGKIKPVNSDYIVTK